jgi:hypothetical protein
MIRSLLLAVFCVAVAESALQLGQWQALMDIYNQTSEDKRRALSRRALIELRLSAQYLSSFWSFRCLPNDEWRVLSPRSASALHRRERLWPVSWLHLLVGASKW